MDCGPNYFINLTSTGDNTGNMGQVMAATPSTSACHFSAAFSFILTLTFNSTCRLPHAIQCKHAHTYS